MAYSDYVPVTGTIMNISRENDCCTQRILLRTKDGIINFIMNAATRIIDNRQLRAGMQIMAFYDSNLPVPLIFPPQYQAQLITVIGRNEQVMLHFFDENLTAADNSLQLNISEDTIIRTVNGQNFSCNPGNHVLLVYYRNTTRSIPPQTTPDRIIVLC